MDRKEGEHAAGLAFLDAVGVVQGSIGGGVHAGVMEIADAEILGLLGDGRRDVSLIIGRPDAWGNDAGEIRGICAIGCGHFTDGMGEDVLFGSLLSGVEQGDGTGDGIGKVDGGAVCHVDGEELPGEIGDEPVHAGVGEDFRGRWRGDHGDPVSMDLFGMMAVEDCGEFLRDESVVVRGEVAESEVAIAEDIDIREPRDPVRPEPGKAGDWI